MKNRQVDAYHERCGGAGIMREIRNHSIDQEFHVFDYFFQNKKASLRPGNASWFQATLQDKTHRPRDGQGRVLSPASTGYGNNGAR